MANPPPVPRTGDETGSTPNGGSSGGTPRWVKVFGIVILAVVVLIVVMIVSGRGGGHGPGRHTGGASQVPYGSPVHGV